MGKPRGKGERGKGPGSCAGGGGGGMGTGGGSMWGSMGQGRGEHLAAVAGGGGGLERLHGETWGGGCGERRPPAGSGRREPAGMEAGRARPTAVLSALGSVHRSRWSAAELNVIRERNT